MSTLPTLPNLSNELPSLSLAGVGSMLKSMTPSSSTVASTLASAAIGGVSNLFTIQNVVTVVGFIFLIIGLVTVTKLHQPIIAGAKDAVKAAGVAAVAA